LTSCWQTLSPEDVLTKANALWRSLLHHWSTPDGNGTCVYLRYLGTFLDQRFDKLRVDVKDGYADRMMFLGIANGLGTCNAITILCCLLMNHSVKSTVAEVEG
jgi:hypothetical protein